VYVCGGVGEGELRDNVLVHDIHLVLCCAPVEVGGRRVSTCKRLSSAESDGAWLAPHPAAICACSFVCALQLEPQLPDVGWLNTPVLHNLPTFVPAIHIMLYTCCVVSFAFCCWNCSA
jgi:hypothetical protein